MSETFRPPYFEKKPEVHPEKKGELLPSIPPVNPSSAQPAYTPEEENLFRKWKRKEASMKRAPRARIDEESGQLIISGRQMVNVQREMKLALFNKEWAEFGKLAGFSLYTPRADNPQEK
jgi:hypothetical protein